MRFNSSTRVIRGTPESASPETDYTYTVTDSNEDTNDLTFRLRVAVPSASGSGGGGGCAVSDQSSVVPDIFGAVACLILIPVSAVIRRKRRSHIKT